MYDVVVIGGGHAGVEAAASAARLGASVALVTFSSENLGQMSCNPSVGGVGKGHIVREIDVFEALMPLAADRAALHYRMLNSGKGPAVRGPRIQADRALYRRAISLAVLALAVDCIEGEVIALNVAGGRIAGVSMADGTEIEARSVIVTTGTFLGGRVFRGDERALGGRAEERSATRLGEQFSDLGLVQGRLKTGTPPRIDGRTINWASLQPQPSDRQAWSMSLRNDGERVAQLSCAISRTTPATHDYIRANEDKSPLYSGDIDGRGPRYCPSIEDKVRRFADRDHHQIFLEPEGLGTHLIYPNGISTSLPTTVQAQMIRTMDGLERAVIVAPGYAVEYAYCDPRRLDRRLHHREIEGLFLAGQINGTTGYEEAAGQGLVAGLNAAADAKDLDPFLFDRAQSYIGVMVDDLTIQGVSEPYRMMTARSEFRLHLRADNAPERLGDLARRSGISPAMRQRLEERESQQADTKTCLNAELTAEELGVAGDMHRRPLREWVLRPEAEKAVRARFPESAAADVAFADAYYAPYLDRQQREWEQVDRQRQTVIPSTFDYASVQGLSSEMIERLDYARPDTIDQASRVQGITPAALTAIHLRLMRARAA